MNPEFRGRKGRPRSNLETVAMATGPSHLCYRESNWRKDRMGTVKYASRVVAPKTVYIPVLSGILSSPPEAPNSRQAHDSADKISGKHVIISPLNLPGLDRDQVCFSVPADTRARTLTLTRGVAPAARAGSAHVRVRSELREQIPVSLAALPLCTFVSFVVPAFELHQPQSARRSTKDFGNAESSQGMISKITPWL